MSNQAITMGVIPTLAPDQVEKTLRNMYYQAITKGVPFKALPSVMLWSGPGVGKSQTVHTLGTNLERETGKKVHVTDVRLLLFSNIDLRGIPTANEDKTLAKWLKPEIFQMDPCEDVLNILFLDEISAAPQSVQAAAYQITLDRVIGEHKLPDNCIVIAAGNRVTDKSVAFQMPKALANRLLHIEMTNDIDSWRRWAVSKGIHPFITGFLEFKPDYLNRFDPQETSLAFATPRSWEMASNILNTVSDDFKIVFDLLSGILGTGVATELRTWSKVYSKLPDVEGIFLGKKTPVPTDLDVLFALTSSMAAYAYQYRNDMDKIANSIVYADTLPPDFSVVVLKDYLYLEPNYKLKLLKVPEFATWLQKKGRLLDATK